MAENVEGIGIFFSQKLQLDVLFERTPKVEQQAAIFRRVDGIWRKFRSFPCRRYHQWQRLWRPVPRRPGAERWILRFLEVWCPSAIFLTLPSGRVTRTDPLRVILTGRVSALYFSHLEYRGVECWSSQRARRRSTFGPNGTSIRPASSRYTAVLVQTDRRKDGTGCNGFGCWRWGYRPPFRVRDATRSPRARTTGSRWIFWLSLRTRTTKAA